MSFEIDAEIWVAVAFLIFVGVLAKLGVPRMILNALDGRSTQIKIELDEARRIRDEAQALLAAYQRKRQEADREAEAIITAAKKEAELVAAEAKTKVEEFVARRTKIAETKIAQAEAQALADVRAAAADAAVAAAARILTETTKGRTGDELIARGIRDLKAKLN
ncbi:MAG TPA: ATP F0F1 synthase subunit B [Xanthobacteraceae bacterium]|jgi:F-type H+-transporting ATPase subunit b